MEQPLVSIIIPVYKVEKYLRRCLDSVRNQTYKNIEVILVDDGSPDNCPQICDEYAEKDSRFHVVHKENGGLSSARNAGLDMCTGLYVGFVDSDDFISCEMYEHMMNRMLSDKSDICTCATQKVNDNGDIVLSQYTCEGFEGIISAKVAMKKAFGRRKEAYTVSTAVWDKLFKTSLFNNVRFPDGRVWEDIQTLPFLFDRSNLVSGIKKKYYYYVQRENSIAHNPVNEIKFLEALIITAKTLYSQSYYEESIHYLHMAISKFSSEKCSNRQLNDEQVLFLEKVKSELEYIYHLIPRQHVRLRYRLYFYIFFKDPTCWGKCRRFGKHMKEIIKRNG